MARSKWLLGSSNTKKLGGSYNMIASASRAFSPPDSTPQLRVLHLAAWVIAMGSLVTCGTRLHAIANQLRAR